MSGTLRGKAVLATVIVAGAAVANPGHGGDASAAVNAPRQVKIAVRYAVRQLGKPYQLGAAGPGAFDCSGLVWRAYRKAGVTLPRTSQAQWAALPHIPASKRGPGTLEFIVGADGTWSSPGHEVLLISRNKAIEAYGTGHPVRTIDLRNPPPGDQNVVGFANPAGR